MRFDRPIRIAPARGPALGDSRRTSGLARRRSARRGCSSSTHAGVGERRVLVMVMRRGGLLDCACLPPGLRADRQGVVVLRAAAVLVRGEARGRWTVHPARTRDGRYLELGDVGPARRRAALGRLGRAPDLESRHRHHTRRRDAAVGASAATLRDAKRRQSLEGAVTARAAPLVEGQGSSSRAACYSITCGCSFQSSGSCVIHTVAP